MKPRTNPRKVVTLEGYCRICWKRLWFTLDLNGMTQDDIREHCQEHARCCKTPDIRVMC